MRGLTELLMTLLLKNHKIRELSLHQSHEEKTQISKKRHSTLIVIISVTPDFLEHSNNKAHSFTLSNISMDTQTKAAGSLALQVAYNPI